MGYLVSTIYAVFLGSTISSLFNVDTTGGDIDVNTLIRRSNWLVTIPILLIFVIDWASFVGIFPIEDTFSIGFQDYILLFLYLPSIYLLSVSAVMSLDSSGRQYMVMFSLYHLVSFAAEFLWFCSKIVNRNGDISPNSVGVILLISVIYTLLKCGVVSFGFLFYNSVGRVRAVPIVWLSLILKPALFVAISNLMNINYLV